MSSVRKSLYYSVFSKYISRFIGLASVIFIARMLTPDELGIFAIASSLVLIASELKSFGADGYLIREPSIDKELVSKALGVSSIISWTVGSIVLISSWSIEMFYDKPDIAPLIQILSLSFFLSPHIGIGKSLMARNFQFERLLIVDSLSQVCQLLCVVILVYLDFGYFSVGIATVLGYIVELSLVLFFKSELFCFKPTFSGTNFIAKFGFYVTLSNLLRKLGFTLPELMIGKIGSASEVAYFSRATGFINFVSMTINSGIRPVIAPFLADKKRQGKELSEPFLQASRFMSGLMSPVLSVAAYSSETIVVVMFGDQWLRSAPLVSILCIAAIIRSSISMSVQTLITAGLEKPLFILELLLFILTAVLVFLCYPFGLEAIAWAFVVIALARFLMFSVLLTRFFNLKIISIIANQFINIAISTCCVSTLWLYEFFFPHTKLLEQFFTIVIISGISWVTFVYVFRHPLASEISKVVKFLISKLRYKEI